MTPFEFPEELRDVPGARDLYDWFGYWPTLHDGELVDIVLRTQGESLVCIYSAMLTGRVNTRGTYEQVKHVVVRFVLEDVNELALQDFSIQNVMRAVVLTRVEEGFQLYLEPVYGIGGKIRAARVKIEIEPGVLPNRPGFPIGNV